MISHGDLPLDVVTIGIETVVQFEQGLQDTVWSAASRSSCKDVADIAATRSSAVGCLKKKNDDQDHYNGHGDGDNNIT
ncbi:hypothetical protein BGZ80_003267, partial [Entomortierella chlamydospora]